MPVSRRVVLATMTALWAVAVLFAGLLSLTMTDAVLFGTAACGGFLGGLGLAAYFGRAGRIGWVWAFGAGLAATCVGGFLAGAGMNLLAAPEDVIFGSRANILGSGLLGALVALSWPVSEIQVAAVWLAGLAGIHLTARKLGSRSADKP